MHTKYQEDELIMQPRKLIEFLNIIEKLKCNTRHCWTSNGRQESVADHSWRLAVMALLVADEFPDINCEKVIKMCLIHDLGEAITGDIPVFLKTKKDQETEDFAIADLLKLLPENIKLEFTKLFSEMAELNTQESKLVKALDKLEALISHNEAHISTWIPHEYSLNLNYADEYVTYSDYLNTLRKEIKQDTIRKIENT